MQKIYIFFIASTLVFAFALAFIVANLPEEIKQVSALIGIVVIISYVLIYQFSIIIPRQRRRNITTVKDLYSRVPIYKFIILCGLFAVLLKIFRLLIS